MSVYAASYTGAGGGGGELHTGGRRKVIPQVVWFFSIRFKEAAARTERDGQSECGGPSGTSTLL